MVEAGRSARNVGIEVPRPAPQHPRPIVRQVRGLTLILRERPLPHVPRHVQSTEGRRALRVRSHRGGLSTIGRPSGSSLLKDIGEAGLVALPPRILAPVCAARCLLPFLLGRQANLRAVLQIPRRPQPGRQPAREGHRILPAHRFRRQIGTGPRRLAWLLLTIGQLRWFVPPVSVAVSVRRACESLPLGLGRLVLADLERGQGHHRASGHRVERWVVAAAHDERPGRYIDPGDVRQAVLAQALAGILRPEADHRGPSRAEHNQGQAEHQQEDTKPRSRGRGLIDRVYGRFIR